MQLKLIGNNFCPEYFNYLFGTYVNIGTENKIIIKNIAKLPSFERTQLLYNIMFLRHPQYKGLWQKNMDFTNPSKRLKLIWSFLTKTKNPR